jgi:hypothetical protein
MGEFDWGDMGWSDWNTGGDYDTGADFDWGSVDNYDYGYDYGGGGGGGGDYGWGADPQWGGNGAGAGSIDWGNAGWSDWNTQSGEGAWWSGSGENASTNGGYAAGQGEFGQGQGMNDSYGWGEAAAAPTTGNAGITGDMGGAAATEEQKKTPSLLENVQGGFKSLQKFGKDNADLARLGIGIAGVMTARKDQKRADQMMEQTLADREWERKQKEQLYAAQLANMHRASGQSGAAHRSQSSAVKKNNAQADFWNNQARTSANEARSLYNPQELGVRGYAQEQAATGRSVQDIRDKMSRQGKSQSAIDAEVRRAKLTGSTNATTGYMKGLDTGRTAQTGALSSAKGLGSSYSALGSVAVPGVSVPSMGSNSDLAQYYSDQASGNSNAIQDLLNYYLGNPLGQSNDNRTT